MSKKLTFVQALSALENGKKVRSDRWPIDQYVHKLTDRSYAYSTGGTFTLRAAINSRADNWEEVPELHNFEWALKKMREGEIVQRVG